VSNIIGGNLKSKFVDVGLSCVLSTPAITNGRDFRVAPPMSSSPRVPFSHKENVIIVEAGVKQDKSAAALPEEADDTPAERKRGCRKPFCGKRDSGIPIETGR
jgi:flagellar motor switch protein FliN/FliY